MKTIKITVFENEPIKCEMSELLTGREMGRVLRALEVENSQQRRLHQRGLRNSVETRNDINENLKEQNDAREPEGKTEPTKLPERSTLAGAIAAKQAGQSGQQQPVSTRTAALGTAQRAH